MKLKLFAICFLVACVGCKTGGTTISKHSAGKIISPKTGEQLNKESKAKREESEKFKNAKAVATPPVKLSSARSKPKSLGGLESAKPNTSIGIPVVPETRNQKPESLLPLVNVLPITNNPPKPVTNNPSKGEPSDEVKTNNPKEKEMKINWLELSMYYFFVILVLIIAYLAYDTVRAISKSKKNKPKTKKRSTKKRPAKKRSK